MQRYSTRVRSHRHPDRPWRLGQILAVAAIAACRSGSVDKGTEDAAGGSTSVLAEIRRAGPWLPNFALVRRQ